MWITPLHPPLKLRGKVHMAQFSVKIMRLTGSLLRENQQTRRYQRRRDRFRVNLTKAAGL
jgi:hypothetical protein